MINKITLNITNIHVYNIKNKNNLFSNKIRIITYISNITMPIKIIFVQKNIFYLLNNIFLLIICIKR